MKKTEAVHDAASRFINHLDHRSIRIFFVLLCSFLVLIGSFLIKGKFHVGPNYSIYEYMGSYFDSHGHYPLPQLDNVSSIHANLRDYIPLNGLIYRIIFHSPKAYHQIFFIIYEASILTIGLLLFEVLRNRKNISVLYFYAVLTFVLLNPMIWRLLAIDDKALFLTGPLLPIVTAEGASLYTFAASMGLYAGWTGLGIASAPLIAVLRLRSSAQRICLLGLTTLVVAALLFADGQAGLTGIHYRSQLESLKPFWYSIWRLAPMGIPLIVRQAVFIPYEILVLLLFSLSRISFVQALTISSGCYLLLSNNTVPTRIIFFVPVLALCFHKDGTRIVYLIGSFGLLYFSRLIAQTNPETLSTSMIKFVSLCCNLPLILPIAWSIFGGRTPLQSSAISRLVPGRPLSESLESSSNNSSAVA